MNLCVIKARHAAVLDTCGQLQVVVFHLLGDDYWGTTPDTLVMVAGGRGQMVYAGNLVAGMRVYLDVEALKKSGMYQTDCVINGTPGPRS